MAVEKRSIAAVVLAGGSATRMEDLCEEVPKPMISFGGIPFLQYLVSWLVKSGCGEVLIAAGHLSRIILDCFDTFFWSTRGVKVIVEPVPLGTGGAFRLAAEFLGENDLFLCNGDTVVDLNLEEAVRLHSCHSETATAILTLRENVPNQGAVLVRGDRVIGFREGEGPRRLFSSRDLYNASSTGSYLFRRSAVMREFLLGNSSLELNFIPKLAAQGKLRAFNNGKRFFWDYGTRERLAFMKKHVDKLQAIYGAPLAEYRTHIA